MNCKSYIELTPKEKTDYIGRVVHAVQNSEACFSAGQQIIECAELLGIFRGTQLMPGDCKKELNDLKNPIE